MFSTPSGASLSPTAQPWRALGGALDETPEAEAFERIWSKRELPWLALRPTPASECPEQVMEQALWGRGDGDGDGDEVATHGVLLHVTDRASAPVPLAQVTVGPEVRYCDNAGFIRFDEPPGNELLARIVGEGTTACRPWGH